MVGRRPLDLLHIGPRGATGYLENADSGRAGRTDHATRWKCAVESPDGRFLYYTKQITPSQNSLWRMPLAGGDEEKLLDGIFRLSFVVTERGIYYAVAHEPVGTIEFLDPATGRHTVLYHTDKRLDLGLSVSPDGRYLLYPQIDFDAANLMMIENFR